MLARLLELSQQRQGIKWVVLLDIHDEFHLQIQYKRGLELAFQHVLIQPEGAATLDLQLMLWPLKGKVCIEFGKKNFPHYHLDAAGVGCCPQTFATTTMPALIDSFFQHYTYTYGDDEYVLAAWLADTHPHWPTYTQTPPHGVLMLELDEEHNMDLSNCIRLDPTAVADQAINFADEILDWQRHTPLQTLPLRSHCTYTQTKGPKDLTAMYLAYTHWLLHIPPTIHSLAPWTKDVSANLPPQTFRIWLNKTADDKCGGRGVQSNTLTTTAWTQRIIYDVDVQPFLVEHFGADDIITHAFHRINPLYGAARADFLRYLLLFVYGGLYMDLTIAQLQTVPAMPHDADLMVCHWPYGCPQSHLFAQGELMNCVFLARPGSLSLKRVIEQVVYNIFNFNIETMLPFGMDAHTTSLVLTVTGPIAFTMALQRDMSTVSVNEQLNTCIGLYHGDPMKGRHVGAGHYSRVKTPLLR
jgi:hypothetical protein